MTDTAEPGRAEATGSRQALRAVTSISLLTLASRILGFVRDMVMFRLLGAGPIAGTFILAWMFPNMLRRLVGEGALSAAFIPAFAAKLDRGGSAEAKRLLGSVSGAAVAVLTLLSAVVIAACWILPPHWVSATVEHGELLLLLTGILFPYVIGVSLIALYSGALNALGVFGWPAALPVVLNVFWIAALALGAMLYPDDGRALTLLSAAALLVAGVVQVGICAWLLRKRGCLPRLQWPKPGDPARPVFAAMAPTALGMSMVQLNALLDQGFAYWLISEGANSHVYLANRLLLFPHALTTVALATVAFPRFAVLAARDQLGTLRARVDEAAHLTAFLTVPASIGLVLVAHDFIELCFADGKFTLEDAHWSALTTVCLVVGLPFIGSAQLYARALYALSDMRTPARITAMLVPLNILINVVLVLGLGLGVPGVTLGTSLCSVINAFALRQRFRALCPGEPAAFGPTLRIFAATLLMAAVVLGMQQLLPGLESALGLDQVVTQGSKLHLALVGSVRIALPIGLGVLVYLATHWLAGGKEWSRLRRRR